MPSLPSRPPNVYRRPTYTPPEALLHRMLEWFATRGIPEAVVRRHCQR